MTLVSLLLLGCGADRGRGLRPFPPHGEEESTSAPPRPPGATDGAAGRSTSAVVFVEFVATPQDVVERMLEMAHVSKTDVVYDLGCGDGRIVITAARRYGCRAVGYDLDPLRVQEARENAAKHKVSHLVGIEKQDVLHVDLQEATVVILYLGTEINARLIPQLAKLRPGARIVSHDFPIGDLTPDQAMQMTSRTDGCRHAIYLWKCPLAVDQR